ncbi:MAG: hypothetical protein HY681_04900 [Chloroflexi bacterium]|nr:hypothetical protein [Chloroflexota bacterium]
MTTKSGAGGPHPQEASPQLLKEIFTRNAYIRVPDMVLRKELGQKYKKGCEVRFAVRTQEEVEALSRLLREAGFAPARPFQKANHIILPVYGKKAVACFLEVRKSAAE